MTDPHQRSIAIYQDTMKLCRTDPALAQSIRASTAATVFYPAGRTPDGAGSGGRAGLVEVTGERSIEAASRLHRDNAAWRIAVHNFASATNPGGGVERGSNAQEESICRITTLHPCLKTDYLWENYYRFHRQRRDVTYTDAAIFTPGVTVIKSDSAVPVTLSAPDRFRVDILTCAAPNLRPRPYNTMNPGQGSAVTLTDEELKAIHIRRAEKLLAIAAAQGDDCVVLGAFGCGAFRNDPSVVAQAYLELLPRWRDRFDRIVFAVYSSPRDARNYDTFRRVLTPLLQG